MMATTLLAASGTVRRGIEYGQAGDTRLLMDSYVPPGPGPFPAVIIVHGGAWIAGDRRLSVEPLFQPLADGGYAWFSISYRLANQAMMFGAAIQDVKAAALYVQAHAEEYNVDPARIALAGESAGAQLASMAALSPELKDVVKGVVALYSPSDLVSLAKTSNRVPPELRRAVEGTPWAAFLLGGLQRLSPLYNVRSDMPPFLFIHGTADSLVPFAQSEHMCQRMREVGAACDLYAVQGGGHGIRWWEHSTQLTAYKKAMVDWLDKLFANTPVHV
jgi:acetyl esterase